MLLVSIAELGNNHKNFSTVENIAQLYRGLCAGLDVQKFVNMSNYSLFFCNFDFNYDELIETDGVTGSLFAPGVENLADSVYEYMRDNVDVYYDILTKIDEYRQQVKNYNVDK